MHKNKKRIIKAGIVLASIVVFVGIYLAVFSHIKINSNFMAAVTGNANPEKKTEPVTTLFFVGDIMLDRAVRSSVVKNFGGDYGRLFENVSELKNADILFGNLEGDVSDRGNNVGSKYSFRMNPIVLPALKDAGFDIVSFANNHVGDWNMAAFTDTLTRLNSAGILKAGAGMIKSEAEAPTIIERNGTKFGFLGFSDVGPNWLAATETTAGILLASDPSLPEIIQNAKKSSDVLIVSFHWGIEYKKVHTSRQEKLAHIAIDNGADMIIGHHPHVMEDIETYNGHPIVYSLGNFIFDQYFSKDTMKGMLFEATFTGKTLIGTSRKTIELSGFYQPKGIYEYIPEKETVSKEKAIVFTCPKPAKEYEDETYRDVGQTTSLIDTKYIPSDLVQLSKSISKSSICLKKDAADALEDLIEDMKKEKLMLSVTSGFRSYATQQALYTADLKISKSTTSDSVAKPGYSEHQLGIAVDLTSPSILYASASGKFEDTLESEWLEKHAFEYGFIQSYPKGKETITGYMYEPWHYRWVGIENAKEIVKNGQTINEFFTKKR